MLTLFDCATGKVIYKVPCDISVASLAFSKDGRSFVVGGEQGQITVSHTGTGQPLFEIAHLGTPIGCIQPVDNGFRLSTKRVQNGRTELEWLEF